MNNATSCSEFLFDLNHIFQTSKTDSTSLAPIAVEILLCRCSAQKIGTDSGKKLLKISRTVAVSEKKHK